MRGHLVKRGKDSYSIVLNLGKDPTTGRRKQQWVSVKGTKKDAEKRLSELIHQLDNGTFMKPGKTMVGDYLEQWLTDYCTPNLQPRTTEGYRYIINTHLIPSLGQIPLTALRPEHLQRLYAEKLASGRCDGSGGLSARSVRYLHTTLHKALKDALRLGMIARNPAAVVEPPHLKRHEMQTMSESDIHLLLEYARPTPYYHCFYLALFTGLRRSELLALKWSDVDLLLCQLSVVRTIHQLHNREIIISPCKTDKSKRLVSLSPSTIIALREHKEAEARLRQELGLPFSDDDYVFAHYDGSPLLPDSISQAWRKLARRCGLKVRLHDARHTHASLMLKANIHPKVVSERLGHASIQITLDTYSHVSPGLQQAAAIRFDDLVAPRRENEAVEKVR